MLRARVLAALAPFALVACSAQAAPHGPEGLPRMASLRDEVVYGRRGPGRDHRIDWDFRKKGLPVMVLEESDGWAKIRDPKGAVVWVKMGALAAQRTVYVASPPHGGEPLLAGPDLNARVVARLGEGVIGRLEACRAGWRKIAVEDRVGWAPAKALWGAEDCRDD